jgi:outer membrane protein TolC
MRRVRAQHRQRATRARLAQLLDRPDDLPANLIRPTLPDNDQPLPDYQQLVDAALARNPQLLALKSELDAARLRVEAERAGGRPVLSGSLSASTYQRNLSGYNPLEAELRLDIPLYEGDRVNADVARAQADKYRLEARLRQTEYDLRQDLLEVWLNLQTMLAQREQAKVFSDARERDFDLAQAEYELDLNTDFGDSLVGQSDAALLIARTEFQLAIDWARLSALTAGAYSPYLREAAPQQPGNDPHETQHR